MGLKSGGLGYFVFKKDETRGPFFLFDITEYNCCFVHILPHGRSAKNRLCKWKTYGLRPGSPQLKQPAEGVKLYLLNRDFKTDSINLINSRKAIVDSVVSNITGGFMISEIPQGNYTLVPFSTDGYFFKVEDTDSLVYSFTVESNHPDIKINYIASIQEVTNSEKFSVTINIINRDTINPKDLVRIGIELRTRRQNLRFLIFPFFDLEDKFYEDIYKASYTWENSILMML